MFHRLRYKYSGGNTGNSPDRGRAGEPNDSDDSSDFCEEQPKARQRSSAGAEQCHGEAASRWRRQCAAYESQIEQLKAGTHHSAVRQLSGTLTRIANQHCGPLLRQWRVAMTQAEAVGLFESNAQVMLKKGAARARIAFEGEKKRDYQSTAARLTLIAAVRRSNSLINGLVVRWRSRSARVRPEKTGLQACVTDGRAEMEGLKAEMAQLRARCGSLESEAERATAEAAKLKNPYEAAVAAGHIVTVSTEQQELELDRLGAQILEHQNKASEASDELKRALERTRALEDESSVLKTSKAEVEGNMHKLQMAYSALETEKLRVQKAAEENLRLRSRETEAAMAQSSQLRAKLEAELAVSSNARAAEDAAMAKAAQEAARIMGMMSRMVRSELLMRLLVWRSAARSSQGLGEQRAIVAKLELMVVRMGAVKQLRGTLAGITIQGYGPVIRQWRISMIQSEALEAFETSLELVSKLRVERDEATAGKVEAEAKMLQTEAKMLRLQTAYGALEEENLRMQATRAVECALNEQELEAPVLSWDNSALQLRRVAIRMMYSNVQKVVVEWRLNLRDKQSSLALLQRVVLGWFCQVRRGLRARRRALRARKTMRRRMRVAVHLWQKGPSRLAPSANSRQKVEEINSSEEELKQLREKTTAAPAEDVGWLDALQGTGPAKQLSLADRLTIFYTAKNPEKLEIVQSLLDKYAGNEDALFAKMSQKYVNESVELDPSALKLKEGGLAEEEASEIKCQVAEIGSLRSELTETTGDVSSALLALSEAQKRTQALEDEASVLKASRAEVEGKMHKLQTAYNQLQAEKLRVQKAAEETLCTREKEAAMAQISHQLEEDELQLVRGKLEELRSAKEGACKEATELKKIHAAEIAKLTSKLNKLAGINILIESEKAESDVELSLHKELSVKLTAELASKAEALEVLAQKYAVSRFRANKLKEHAEVWQSKAEQLRAEKQRLEGRFRVAQQEANEMPKWEAEVQALKRQGEQRGTQMARQIEVLQTQKGHHDREVQKLEGQLTRLQDKCALYESELSELMSHRDKFEQQRVRNVECETKSAALAIEVEKLTKLSGAHQVSLEKARARNAELETRNVWCEKEVERMTNEVMLVCDLCITTDTDNLAKDPLDDYLIAVATKK